MTVTRTANWTNSALGISVAGSGNSFAEQVAANLRNGVSGVDTTTDSSLSGLTIPENAVQGRSANVAEKKVVYAIRGSLTACFAVAGTGC